MLHMLRHTLCLLCALALCQTATAYSPAARQDKADGQDFVSVKDGRFCRRGKDYSFVGTNFWYGPILASEGQGGDRPRLKRELDAMQQAGIRNLRILAGAEGSDKRITHIRPILQPSPGEYNDTLLRGLDFLIAELERRDMTAVIYLNNAWEWSGGFGAYLEWADEGEAPEPSDWQAFLDYHCRFVQNAKAMELATRHAERIVSRINSITGKPYTQSPAIMAWELANEPRPFSRRPEVKEAFLAWAQQLARRIKALDPNHLVTTGSEGYFGCECDMTLFRRLHTLPEIDYACLHLWPHTWGWMGKFVSPMPEARRVNGSDGTARGFQSACEESRKYIEAACNALKGSGRPVVIEEFGYPRDGYATTATSSTAHRNAYYAYIFRQVLNFKEVAGCNFWGWGGEAQPLHNRRHPADPYTCDPNHEEQGLYSVFRTDYGTLKAVSRAAQALYDKKQALQ